MTAQLFPKTAKPVRQEDFTFLMLGCQRCGSTWVDKALRGHPEVHLPPQKQTYFYDRNYERGLDWYLGMMGELQPGAKAIGEVATGYCLTNVFPKVISDFPDIKMIISVRDPVERAVSYYRSRKDVYGWTSVQQAIEEDPQIIERGQYKEQIDLVLQHIPRERLLILFYDDLLKDDRAYLRSILRFLEVDEDYESPALGRRIQVSAFGRTRKLAKRLRLGWLTDAISRSAIGDHLRRNLREKAVQQASNPRSSPEHKLLEAYFDTNIEDLRKLYG